MLGLTVLRGNASAQREAFVAPRAPVVVPAVPLEQHLEISPKVVDAPPPPPPPAPVNLRGALPVGKGMWIWKPEAADGGNVAAIVARAQRVGLTHLYVRMGSSVTGFTAGPFLDALLPAAHAGGFRVYGWDFPYLDDVGADVARAVQAARYTTPDGHRIDGFAADIEFRSMGVNITPETAAAYGLGLRAAVGPAFPLIAVVPRPNPAIKNFPYDQVVNQFDAIAPMVYWLNSDPTHALRLAFRGLAHYGKPILPIGQAYDGFPEGGPPGVPNRGSIHQFMGHAAEFGASGVSFWSWQHATEEAWQAIQDAAVFQLPAGPLETWRPDQILAYQVLLTSLGFGVPATGTWTPETAAAVAAYQAASRLPATGVVDIATRAFMLTPIAPPLK